VDRPTVHLSTCPTGFDASASDATIATTTLSRIFAPRLAIRIALEVEMEMEVEVEMEVEMEMELWSWCDVSSKCRCHRDRATG